MAIPFVQLQDSVLSFTDIIPTSPGNGDRYLVKPGATGAWSGLDNSTVTWVIVAWDEQVPDAGWVVYVQDEEQYYFFDGTDWLGTGVIRSNDPAEDVGSIGAAGVSIQASRADHVHAHADQGGGTEHTEVVAAGAAGFMSGADKTKLDGITAGADVAPVDSVHGRIGVVVGAVGDYSMPQISGEINDAQHGARAGGTLHAVVVAAGASGFMSGADKTKLDGIATGADVNLVTSVHGRTGVVVSANGDYDFGQITGTISAAQHGTQTDGTLHAVVVANGASGFMTGADKDKLDNFAPGGGGIIMSDSDPASLGILPAPGTSIDASRSDHVHTHGVQPGGPTHVNVIPSGLAGFMSGADKTRLDDLVSQPDKAIGEIWMTNNVTPTVYQVGWVKVAGSTFLNQATLFDSGGQDNNLSYTGLDIIKAMVIVTFRTETISTLLLPYSFQVFRNTLGAAGQPVTTSFDTLSANLTFSAAITVFPGDQFDLQILQNPLIIPPAVIIVTTMTFTIFEI